MESGAGLLVTSGWETGSLAVHGRSAAQRHMRVVLGAQAVDVAAKQLLEITNHL